ncbi:MAG TPA: CAP domain-containing protein [Rhizomicrobium sp.]|nr:CAP domain-containing protein [Rhizomicrobium sp.]
MHIARAGIVAAALSAAVACTGVPIGRPAPVPPDPATLMPALEQRIFDLVEAERLRIDPKAKMLVLDSELVGVARTHSTDMATKNYFGHAGPDGRTTADIIMDRDQDFQGLLGENIAAQHFVPDYPIDVDVLAHHFVESWLASPPHKDNLAFAAYDRSGVGAAVSGNTIYVTQLFAAEMGPPPPKSKTGPRHVSQLASPHAAESLPPESPAGGYAKH